MSVEKYLNANKQHWNERVPIHMKSAFYELVNFKKGMNKLRPLEMSELGDIKGKSILHLQCHFGMDTLSLERLGANVTGIDFSEEAIKEACNLRDELGMKAEFILTDLYSLPQALNKKFDIIYTSYGVLIWLPDIIEWGNIISHFLKKEGFLYMAEVHPASMMFDNSADTMKPEIKHPYFNKPEPLKFDEPGTYADSNAQTVNNISYEWTYSVSDILMSLINAGLKIEFFHEFPFTVWKQFSGMKKCEDGYYRLDQDIPLLFSLRARK